MKNSLNTPSQSQSKVNHFVTESIVNAIEKGSGLRFSEFKERYNEEQLFYQGLRYVTTTKKAYCEAVGIPVEAGCRYKRKLEKWERLVQSFDKVVCPYTKHFAHLISTNPNEFERLCKSNTNQLNLFE